MYRNLNTTIGGLRPLQTPFVGVLGSEVPSTGEGGRPGWLYTTVQSSGWGADRVAVWVESTSRAGLFVNDDTSWTWNNLIGGTHTAVGRVYRNGVDQGTSTLTLIVGDSVGITVAVTDPYAYTLAASATAAPGGFSAATVNVALADAYAYTLSAGATAYDSTIPGKPRTTVLIEPVPRYIGNRIIPE